MTLEGAGDVSRADPDLAKGHVLLQQRWEPLRERVEQEFGCKLQRCEVYRPELRQMWLYGAGRTEQEVLLKAIPREYARPKEPRVTNAWSARVSAHGCRVLGPDGLLIPASAAVDCGPVGADGHLWTRDDPWDDFVKLLATIGPRFGLVHFHSPGKAVWDRPHLELLEWSNRAHGIIDAKVSYD